MADAQLAPRRSASRARRVWRESNLSAEELRRALRFSASAARAKLLQRFFKTGPGEYGAGDVFLGVRVPAIRKLVPHTDALKPSELRRLLRSRFHEERLLAVLILVRRFQRGDEAVRRGVFDLYLAETRHVDNWDLVDLTAPHIVGAWLIDKDRSLLDSLAASTLLWERRIAVLATSTFIRRGQFDDTVRLCHRLLSDPHDLIHKACGWMLREVGKRDVRVLENFLERHAGRMPRTMLRYAIERLPESRRRTWLRSA